MAIKASISFARKDYSTPGFIEQATLDIADHFRSRRLYIAQFCSMIQNSKRWDTGNLVNKVNIWKNSFSRLPETSNIIRIVENAFLNCGTNDEIHKLRGAIVEGLIIGCHGGSAILNSPSYGWGAQVTIHRGTSKKEIEYNCTLSKEDDCGRRITVDFGCWDGVHSKFFECKVQPDRVGCKEVSYMIHLVNELRCYSVSHEVFFVCACPSDDLRMRLDEWGLSPKYKAIGTAELKEMMRAS